MTSAAVPLVEVHRGDFLESLHHGHVVVADTAGQIIESWGDPAAVVLPRSAVKMIQALPLVASGAAAIRGLGDAQLALACASHQGAPEHVDAITAWLADLGLSERDLRCGAQTSRDPDLRRRMLCDDQAPCQIHNNCSGKHTGFLTLSKHMDAGPEYTDPDHPVQRAVREVFEEVTRETSPGFGIDGCSAPNFASSMAGLARAMGRFAGASARDTVLDKAATRLVEAMYARPDMVAGRGRACTLLMRAAGEPVAFKTGAEGVFIAILPQRGLGVALKIADGATRAAECAIAAVLCRLGVLDPAHPDVKLFLNPPDRNRREIVTGDIRPVADLYTLR